MSLDDLNRTIEMTPIIRNHANLIRQLAKPMTWFDLVPGAPEDPLATRFGGDAMMLPEQGWPSWINAPYTGRDESAEFFTVTYGEPTEVPLTFLGQVNLADLPDGLPLPRQGLLSFFTDATDPPYGMDESDRDGSRLFFTRPEDFHRLQKRPMPNAPKKAGVFDLRPLRPCGAIFARRYRLPAYWDLDETVRELVPKDVYDPFEDLVCGFNYNNEMLGIPKTHQHDPRLAAVRMNGGQLPDEESYARWEGHHAACNKVADDWDVLLSLIDSDDLNLTVNGCFSFLVRKDDMAAGRFDRYWAVRGT
jgi:hypothetical protein